MVDPLKCLNEIFITHRVLSRNSIPTFVIIPIFCYTWMSRITILLSNGDHEQRRINFTVHLNITRSDINHSYRFTQSMNCNERMSEPISCNKLTYHDRFFTLTPNSSMRCAFYKIHFSFCVMYPLTNLHKHHLAILYRNLVKSLAPLYA